MINDLFSLKSILAIKIGPILLIPSHWSLDKVKDRTKRWQKCEGFYFWKMTFSSSILLAQKKYPQDEPLNSCCMVRMWSIAPRTFSERDREILVTNDLLHIWQRMHIDSSVRWFVPKIISHLWKWIPLKDTTLFCCYCVWSLHRSWMIKHFSPFGSICLVSFARVIGQKKITNSGKIVNSSFSIINCSTIFQIST